MDRRGVVTSEVSVSITTLGCKSNQYDSSAMEEALSRERVRLVPFPGPADAYIINTCTVTGSSDSESRQLIRRARRINRDAVIIVTGCYAEVSPDEARDTGADYVLGNSEKERVYSYILRGRTEKPVTVAGPSNTPMSMRAFSSAGRTRMNLKVQDGCDRACSYCIIPRARGASRSLPIEEVEREIDLIVEKGFKEIVLTGIHLGAYGGDLGPREGFSALLKLIEKMGWPCRFRISSLDPDEVTDEVIEILGGSEKICPHLHLSLQSGDDTVLGMMRRTYTSSLFSERVLKLHSSVPDISIGADVIAGFPGEGSLEFENTFELLRGLPVSYLHIFPFSKRKGTPAGESKSQTPARVIRERCERLHDLDRAKRKSFYTGLIGKEATVLVEGVGAGGPVKGKTGNYVTVYQDSAPNTYGFIRVRLTGLREKGMTGEAKDLSLKP